MYRSLKPAIFLVGNPRSGTTLFRLMLTCHKNIVIPPECGFAQWLRDRFSPWRPEYVEDFCAAVTASRKFETWGIAPDKLSRYLKSHAPTEYADAVSLVYECFAESIGRTYERWGDKNNYYLDHILTLNEMFPDAFFIHLVRDGRDVACSYRQLIESRPSSEYAPKLPKGVAEIAAEWSANLRTVRSSLRRLDESRWLEVRYEDLVRGPESTLREVCSALGEPYDPNMLEYHRLNQQQRLEPVEFLQWKAKTVEPPLTSGIGRFEKDLARAEVLAFEQIARDMLVAYRYIS